MNDARVRPDTALAVGAAHALDLVRSNEWPMVAALLIAEGADGESLVSLAGLARSASGWEVDQLLPSALIEAGIPTLTAEVAGPVAARMLAQAVRDEAPHIDHPIIRALARLGPELDYPSGIIGQSYNAAEWLDCDCHRLSPERDEADRLEARLAALPALDISGDMAAALSLPSLDAR